MHLRAWLKERRGRDTVDTLKSRGGPFTDSDQQCKVVEDEAGSSVCQRKYHTSARRRSYLPNPDDTAVQCEEEDENSTAGVWRCPHVVAGQEESLNHTGIWKSGKAWHMDRSDRIT